MASSSTGAQLKHSEISQRTHPPPLLEWPAAKQPAIGNQVAGAPAPAALRPRLLLLPNCCSRLTAAAASRDPLHVHAPARHSCALPPFSFCSLSGASCCKVLVNPTNCPLLYSTANCCTPLASPSLQRHQGLHAADGRPAGCVCFNLLVMPLHRLSFAGMYHGWHAAMQTGQSTTTVYLMVA